MDFVTLSEFRDAVRVLAPMAPVPAVDRAIRSSAIDFCKESNAVREQLSSVTLVSGQNQASLGLSSYVRAIAITDSRYDGEELGLTSPKDLTSNMPDWDTVSGEPALIYLSSGTHVTVAPKPSATNTDKLKLTISVAPSYNAVKVPKDLAEEHYQAVVDGAIGHLFEMKGSDWGDPVLGASYKNRAYIAAIDAKNKADHNSTSRRRTIKYGGY